MAALLALVVLAPAGAWAAVCTAASCGPAPAACCCGDVAADDVPADSRLDGICCCDLEQPAQAGSDRAPALLESTSGPAVAASSSLSVDVKAPPALMDPLPGAPARAPPPGGWSLLAQSTSLLR